MDNSTQQELQETLQVVSSAIYNCEKTLSKFSEGTSQSTLLKNRLNALYISKSLITNNNVMDRYTKEELIKAQRPIISILAKCKKAQFKFVEGTYHYTRIKNLIKAMSISESLISDEINKRG